MNTRVARIVVCFCFWPVFVFAKKPPDGPTVEVKCLVPKEKIAEVSRKLRLGSNAPITRVACFFDTESLALFRHNPKLILRSRYDSSGGSDTTVKVRDGKARGDKVECEFDKVLGKDRTQSCSVTDKEQEKAQIKRANAGKDLKKIFSKEQEATLKNAFGNVDWRKLRPYGPVKEIQVWKKLKVQGGPDLTVERWRLPALPNRPARVLFEVSAKVPLAKEAEVSRWIAGLVGLSDSGGDQQSETKTLIVLEHFRSD